MNESSVDSTNPLDIFNAGFIAGGKRMKLRHAIMSSVVVHNNRLIMCTNTISNQEQDKHMIFPSIFSDSYDYISKKTLLMLISYESVLGDGSSSSRTVKNCVKELVVSYSSYERELLYQFPL